MSLVTQSLSENDIRPDALAVEQERAHAADIAWLQSRKPDFAEVRCPACESASAKTVFSKQQFLFSECQECHTVFINPRPTPEILSEYHAQSADYEFWNTHIFPATEVARRERIFRPRVERTLEICERYGVTAGTLLDVGAGFGTFCEEVRTKAVFEHIIAVEPTPGLAETCRQRGLEVVELPIEEVKLLHNSVDLITSFEVIEHLYSPRQFVETCSRFLKPGGLIVLTCPNIRGFDLVALGKDANNVDANHLNYFHPTSLELLLNRCGLQVLEIQTPGQLDAELVRKKAIAGEIDLSGQPFLKQVLLDEWERVGVAFQSFLAENQLSSHMWIIARKLF